MSEPVISAIIYPFSVAQPSNDSEMPAISRQQITRRHPAKPGDCATYLCSHLSCTHDRIRTCDLRFRKPSEVLWINSFQRLVPYLCQKYFISLLSLWLNVILFNEKEVYPPIDWAFIYIWLCRLIAVEIFSHIKTNEKPTPHTPLTKRAGCLYILGTYIVTDFLRIVLIGGNIPLGSIPVSCPGFLKSISLSQKSILYIRKKGSCNERSDITRTKRIIFINSCNHCIFQIAWD